MARKALGVAVVSLRASSKRHRAKRLSQSLDIGHM